MPEVYTHGHHESVLRSHSWRTAENSAAYLLPHLKPHMRILDVGCGPGTITAGLAAYVPDGHVTGIDSAQDVVDQARQLVTDNSKKREVRAGDPDGLRAGNPDGLRAGNPDGEGEGSAGSGRPGNVDFAVGDVYALDYPDSAFCVTHAHQVLQHLSDPVRALQEMRRVTKPRGIIAVRDADYGAMFWYPRSDALEDWRALYRKVARVNGGEPDAARRLHVWAREAGLADVTVSSSTWTYATAQQRAWWGGTWADRTRKSSFADAAVRGGHTTRADLDRIADAWHAWATDDDGWFCVVNGELLCRVTD